MNHLTGFYFEQEDNMFSTTFKVINNIRIELCHRAAEASHYKGWDDAFARKEIKSVVFNEAVTFRKKRETVILDAHLQDLTESELVELGFREWSVDTPGLWLIPLFLKEYLSQTMIVTDIRGRTYAVADADTDTRFGVCAWGFFHQKSKDARRG